MQSCLLYNVHVYNGLIEEYPCTWILIRVHVLLQTLPKVNRELARRLMSTDEEKKKGKGKKTV